MSEDVNSLTATDWSMIHDLSSDEAQRDAAMERLVRRYWPAIFAYIRRTGRSAHETSDLTQGFIATVLLERRMAQHADQSRGRFRTLLLRSLKHYLIEQHRHASRQRRSHHGKPAHPFSQLDIDASEGRRYASPESAFSYHWSATVVRQVLQRVQEECRRDGLEPHWTVFDERIVRPLLNGSPAPPLSELVERLELLDAAQASNLLVTVKRRFARAIREEIARTVGDPSQIEDELRALMADLEKPA